MASTTPGKNSSRKSAMATTGTKAKSNAMRLLVIAPGHPSHCMADATIAAYGEYLALSRVPTVQVRLLCSVSNDDRQLHDGTPFQAIGERAEEMLFWGGDFDNFLQSQNARGFLYNDFRLYLQQFNPDVVHFHHSAGIGIEALQVVRQTLPAASIVYTLHDHVLLCHNSGRLVTTDGGGLCPGASATRCHQCFPAIAAANFKVRETFIKAHLDNVDSFICPSDASAAAFVSWGLPQEKVSVLANCPITAAAAPSRQVVVGGKRNAIGCFVQTGVIDGLVRMLQALELLLAKGIDDVQLHVFGEVATESGKAGEVVNRLLDKHAAHIRCHGPCRMEQLPALVELVDWIVVADLGREVPSMVMQAARSHRRPLLYVAAASGGAQPEDGNGGLRIEAATAAGLATHLHHALQSDGLWERLIASIPAVAEPAACAMQHLELFRSLATRN